MIHGPEPLVMPWSGSDVPHAVIEVNQRCNISCTACYKDRSTYTKPFEQVEAELDLATSKRNLGVVTLAGGEPSLHPRLPEIIASVARRGIVPQMLSNGMALTDEKLHSYREHGLRRVYLHVDSLQRRPDARGCTSEASLHRLRDELADRVVRNGLQCALSLTLYRTRNLAELPEIVRFVLESPRYDRLLVTCCTDFGGIFAKLRELGRAPDGDGGPPPDQLAGEVVSSQEVSDLLRTSHSLEPYACVASSHRPDEKRWLFYYCYAIHSPEGVEVLRLGSSFERVVRVANSVSRTIRGTYPFGEPVGTATSVALCLAYAATSPDPAVRGKTLRFLSRLRRPGARLVQKSLIFQQGPNLTESGELETCRDCPDATVRNGQLVPVCLADLLSPVPEVQQESLARAAP